MQIQEIQYSTVGLWMNRFTNCYSAIDRVSQKVKAKFVEMKSDMLKAISNKIEKRQRENNEKLDNLQK